MKKFFLLISVIGLLIAVPVLAPTITALYDPYAVHFGETLIGDVTGTFDTDGSTTTTISADAIALGTDTTGNYVASVADGTGIDGTANAEGSTYTPSFDATELTDLTWSDGTSAAIVWTFNVSGTDHTMTASSGLMQFSSDIDVSDAITASTVTASVNVSTPKVIFTDEDASPASVGEFKYDNTVAGLTDGAMCWYDDDAVRYSVDLASLPSVDDYVVAYDAVASCFYMKQDADSGGATAWHNIGNPTADDTIALAGYQIGFSSSLDLIGTILLINHTDADVVSATTGLEIRSVDDAPANLTYFKIVDNTAVASNPVFTIGADGATAMDGGVTAGGTIEGATLTEGGKAVYNDDEMDVKSELEAILTDVTALITDDDIPAVGTDPDLDAAGEIGRDSDGANETGDSSMRGHDGSNQFLYSKKLKTMNFTLISPDTIDAADLIPIWHNTSGMTFTIVEWKAWSDDDDVSFEIEELTDQTDYTARTQVDACEVSTDGTGVYYASDGTITHAAIEHDHGLAIDFDTSDTPDYLQIAITGWFNADVN